MKDGKKRYEEASGEFIEAINNMEADRMPEDYYFIDFASDDVSEDF